MKKIIYVLAAILTIVACKQEPQNYVTLSGEITNQNSDSLLIVNIKTQSTKVVRVNKDGSFKDTLKVSAGIHVLFDGKEQASFFLKNGYKLRVTIDAKQFDESIKFIGKNAESSNYLAKKYLLRERIFGLSNMYIFDLEKKQFDERVGGFVKELKALVDNTSNLDSSFIADEYKEIELTKKSIYNSYEDKQYTLSVLAKGNPSPKFVDYGNYDGGTLSLDDLKGKYVFIDIWATWCGACIKEMPSLHAIEKEFHNKNIQFVGISIDKKKDYEAWRKMVKKKELGGIQLIVNEEDSFIDKYKVSGVPRFILLDPEGNIVSADAPRPSQVELKELLNSLPL